VGTWEETGILWHFVENEAAVGPVTEQEMIDRIRDGRLKPASLVWSESLINWESADSVEIFKSLFRSAPPPIPTVRKEPPPISSPEPAFSMSGLKTYDLQIDLNRRPLSFEVHLGRDMPPDYSIRLFLLSQLFSFCF
jgi:hypothetical protein